MITNNFKLPCSMKDPAAKITMYQITTGNVKSKKVILCLELPCLVQGYSRSALHTCSMWRAGSVHVMELLSDSI